VRLVGEQQVALVGIGYVFKGLQEAKFFMGNMNDIAVFQRAFLDALAIHIGAIGAAQVADDKVIAGAVYFRMLLGNLLGSNGIMGFFVAADAKRQGLEINAMGRAVLSRKMLQIGARSCGSEDHLGNYHYFLVQSFGFPWLHKYRSV